MLLNNKYEYNPKTDLLGVGGFGQVYKARNILLDDVVALKMVTIQGASVQYNLVEEVKKIFKLNHPNIIRYYDVFVINETSATGIETENQVGVMEYIPGGDISRLDWNSLSLEQQIDILLQVLDGLHYLHRNRIIHRDIKPSNILIKREGGRIIPKITDFGISKTQDSGSVSVSRVVGSIPYMAPEQFDSHGKINYNTDFWSLGILVYRLFTGNLPFGDESTTSEGVIMKNIMEMSLPEEVEKIPQPFRSVVYLCLVKDRAKRAKDARVLMELMQGDMSTDQLMTEKEKTWAADSQPENLTEAFEEEITKVYAREAVVKQPNSSQDSGAQEDQPESTRKLTGPTPKAEPAGKSIRKIVYGLMGFASLLLVMVVVWQQSKSDRKEVARQDIPQVIAEDEPGSSPDEEQKEMEDGLALESEEQTRISTQLDHAFNINIKGIKENYEIGETLSFSVFSTMDSYLNIFSITDDLAYLLYPNPWEAQQIIIGGKWKDFPIDDIEYYLERKTIEPEINRLIFVFTKKQFNFLNYKGEEQATSYEEIFSWIHNITPELKNVEEYTFVIR